MFGKIKKYFIQYPNLFFLISGLTLTIINILLFHSYLNIGYLPHDYNFFRDYHNFLNPLTGDRWQPSIYLFNYFAVKVFSLNPFWPKTIILIIYCSNILLAFWLMNLITRNKYLSFIIALIFIVYCRGSTVPLIFTSGSIVGVYCLFSLSVLISFFCYLKYKKKLYFIFSIIFWVMSLMVYESAIVLPFLLILLDILIFKNKLKNILFKMVPFLLIGVIYIFINISTAVPMHKNVAPSNIFQRGDYYLSNYKEILQRFNYFIIAQAPLIIADDNLIQDNNFYFIRFSPTNNININILIFIIIVFSTLLIICLPFPPETKFFVLSFPVLILPYAMFQGSGGIDERYFYFSGLFFYAFLVTFLWFLFGRNIVGKTVCIFIFAIIILLNYKILTYKIQGWQEGADIIKTFKKELLKLYPTNPPPLLFVSSPLFNQYNLGSMGNYYYFIYNNFDLYSYFGENDQVIYYQYAKRYKCETNSREGLEAIALKYQNGELINIDIQKEALRNVNLESIRCP